LNAISNNSVLIIISAQFYGHLGYVTSHKQDPCDSII